MREPTPQKAEESEEESVAETEKEDSMKSADTKDEMEEDKESGSKVARDRKNIWESRVFFFFLFSIGCFVIRLGFR